MKQETSNSGLCQALPMQNFMKTTHLALILKFLGKTNTQGAKSSVNYKTITSFQRQYYKAHQDPTKHIGEKLLALTFFKQMKV